MSCIDNKLLPYTIHSTQSALCQSIFTGQLILPNLLTICCRYQWHSWLSSVERQLLLLDRQTQHQELGTSRSFIRHDGKRLQFLSSNQFFSLGRSVWTANGWGWTPSSSFLNPLDISTKI